MAYRVLMGRKYPFLLLEGRTGERCAHEAPRRGIRKDGTWYTYGWDLTKNICESARRPPKGRLREQAVRAIGQTRSVCPAGARSREAAPSQVFSSGGTILTAYTYTPYGAVTANGNVTQPIQWSSEYNDTELGLIYYNYRYYNPADGRWTGRDLLAEKRSPNRYRVADNDTLRNIDILGLYIYAGNTAVDGTLKGVLSGVLSLEEAAKLLGVSIATVVAMLEKVKGKRAQCRPCDPPVGTWMEKREDSHAHYGMCPHYHLFEVNQSYPAQGCKCFAPKKKTVDKSQGYLSYRKPTGGGLMFV